MTCQELDERLDEWVDGALPAAAASEVEAHLLSCALCRDRERRLRAAARARGGPSAVPHPAPGPVARHRAARGARAFLVVGLERVEPVGPRGGRDRRRRPRRRAVERPLPRRGCARCRSPSRAPWRRSRRGRRSCPIPILAAAERDYEAAANALLEALQQRRSGLQPEALAAVEANLQVIDRALAEVRQALVHDPANRELSRMLVSTHRKKVEVLSRVVKLSNAL